MACIGRNLYGHLVSPSKYYWISIHIQIDTYIENTQTIFFFYGNKSHSEQFHHLATRNKIWYRLNTGKNGTKNSNNKILFPSIKL